MPKLKFWLLVFLFLSDFNSTLSFRTQRTESWTGRWFPEDFSSPKPEITKIKTERIPMGVSNQNCDDAKTNLTLDWDGSFEDFTCLNPRNRFIPDKSIDLLIEFENIPKAYKAPHFCMNEEIKYNNFLPTFGPHRPLWPVYGEYKFLPKQRWIHNLEHGGIVALYHPCADIRQIFLLKNLVKSCLRRYVISPYKELSKERPLALLAWGVRFTMSTIYPNSIRQFIQERALKGPEKVSSDGQFNKFLLEPSTIVSDFEDSNLCPDTSSFTYNI